jgi:hypothetical protein
MPPVAHQRKRKSACTHGSQTLSPEHISPTCSSPLEILSYCTCVVSWLNLRWWNLFCVDSGVIHRYAPLLWCSIPECASKFGGLLVVDRFRCFYFTRFFLICMLLFMVFLVLCFGCHHVCTQWGSHPQKEHRSMWGAEDFFCYRFYYWLFVCCSCSCSLHIPSGWMTLNENKSISQSWSISYE